MRTDSQGRSRVSTSTLIAWTIGFLVVFVAAVSVVASSGHADPTAVAPGAQSIVTSIVNASVIVFREGLEAVLIFAAITASFLGARQQYRRPVAIGVASALGVTLLTWFLMTSVVRSLPVSEDALLAITGITAVVVLLLVMNWFFHKVYWTDHIKELNTKKRRLVSSSEAGDMKYWGFVALGFSAVYREGFEVVLFLQNLNLVAGGSAVFWGVMLGLAGTTIVGFLTFFLHHKLPYKRMLVLTGVLLGVVLVVMVGGSARTLQSMGILSTTPLGVSFPDWWARWFELVPTVETVLVQLSAATFVVGSYYAAEWWSKEKRRRATTMAVAAATTPRGVTAPVPATSAGAELPLAARAPIEASRIFAASSALPNLAWRAPNVASSPAAVLGVERANRLAPPAPVTLCGHPATTMCGCDAQEPAAAALPSSSPAELAARPVTHAPAFTPRPQFEQDGPAVAGDAPTPVGAGAGAPARP